MIGIIERGTGTQALVFIHGIGGGKDAWPAQLEHFARIGFRVIAWDMPGYGDSAPLQSWTISAVAAQLAGVLDVLGLARAVIVGHSLGGMVAQEFAGTYRDRVAALVLFATSPAFGKPEGDFQQAFVAARVKPLDEGRSMADVAAKLVPAMLGVDPDPAARPLAEALMAAVPAATYRAALQALVQFDRREWLARIAVPTLVLAGERDPNSPPAMMRRMAERIAREHVTYDELAGAGHLANLEQPAAFNAALHAFLRRFE